MADTTLQIRIKADYAASLIEHLQKRARHEILEEETTDILDWQEETVRKTPKNVPQHPEQLQAWDIAKQKHTP